MNNVARVKTEGIVSGRGLGEHDSGVQRTQTAGGAVRNEMDVSELLGLTSEIGCGSGCGLGEYLLIGSRKTFTDIFNFECSLREGTELRAGGHRIAHEQHPAFVRTATVAGAFQKAQGTGVGEGDVLDPIMRR